ncbi:MAG: tRNA 2-thiouridine(34) synthase MnmA [Desulfobulbaceae bacterium]|nr:MAG: tRNA 2-thiouridine(34) synthase MnmA [Desulfobulbaceae bacterium]
MSGGVDSTACAIMLQKDHPVQGFFMRLAQPDYPGQLERVQDIAGSLGIGLTVIDLQRQFEEKVLDYFAGSYRLGLTPNPCLVCNREIKFGLLLQAMQAAGSETMATGHYARIVERDGVFSLHKGLDRQKDQSYFLARLRQQQLSRLLLPLGDRSKKETCEFVAAHGLGGFSGDESQDVCFLGSESVGDFLARRLPDMTADGPVVTVDGKEIGRHRGLFRHTIGQRRGLGLPDSTPWYVVRLDPHSNTLVVGKEDDLLQQQVEIADLHWPGDSPPRDGERFEVRLRSTHRGATATWRPAGDDRARLHFDSAQRAVTPGQFAVLYRGDEVVGSGVICR